MNVTLPNGTTAALAYGTDPAGFYLDESGPFTWQEVFCEMGATIVGEFDDPARLDQIGPGRWVSQDGNVMVTRNTSGALNRYQARYRAEGCWANLGTEFKSHTDAAAAADAEWCRLYA